MATIKVKFRPSTVRGKAGVVCYQLCHRQENRQITTDMRIFPHWWNGEKRELVVTPDNEKNYFFLSETNKCGLSCDPENHSGIRCCRG